VSSAEAVDTLGSIGIMSDVIGQNNASPSGRRGRHRLVSKISGKALASLIDIRDLPAMAFA
jgi:hypothetical protein